jgi:hypothetical protein
MPKETSPALSTLSARIMNGYHPTRAEVLSMAGSLLSQDETRGQSEGYIMGGSLNVGSVTIAGDGSQVILTGADGSQVTIPVGGNLALTLAAPAGLGSPAWVPSGALAWADFKDGIYSAAGGSITTLLGMWDKDFPDPDTFDPASVVAGVGLVHGGANLTDAAVADLLAGFTVAMRATDIDFPVRVTAYDTGFANEFYGFHKAPNSELCDLNDLVFDIPTEDSGWHEMKLTITPVKMSMCVDAGPVFTGLPVAGAAFEKISLLASRSTVDRILFLTPQDDAVLPSFSVAG